MKESITEYLLRVTTDKIIAPDDTRSLTMSYNDVLSQEKCTAKRVSGKKKRKHLEANNENMRSVAL